MKRKLNQPLLCVNEGRVWTFALAAVTDWLSLVKKAGEALRHTYGTGQHGTYFQVNVLFIGVFLFPSDWNRGFLEKSKLL